jgi:uncharacterized membrane protein
MKFKLKQIKTLLLTKEGWIAWLLANFFWSTFWLIPLIIGFVFNDPSYYALAGAIYLFFLQPLIPMWLIVSVTVLFIYKIIKKKNPVKGPYNNELKNKSTL